jgi:hypothetical protein
MRGSEGDWGKIIECICVVLPSNAMHQLGVKLNMTITIFKLQSLRKYDWMRRRMETAAIEDATGYHDHAHTYILPVS